VRQSPIPGGAWGSRTFAGVGGGVDGGITECDTDRSRGPSTMTAVVILIAIVVGALLATIAQHLGL
jgi:hypothetical protein